jgi:hypothetical protein
VGLPTLLGLDERPAELASWDFVPAAVARQVITTMMTAEFRWVVCDGDGYAITTGITTARPEVGKACVPPGAMTGMARGIVELQLRTTDIVRLSAAAQTTHPGWKRVVADIVTQIGPGIAPTDGTTAGGTTTGGDTGGSALRAGTPAGSAVSAGTPAGRAVGAGTPAGGSTGFGGPFGSGEDGEVRRRSAGARLRRAIQIRDRYCTFPACRAPARYTDQDHAIDYADGGLTTDANLGCCCRFHHRLKHCRGWVITKLGPHITVWTSVLGHSYVHRIPPVMPSQLRTRPRASYPPEASPTRLSCGCAGHCACGPILPAPSGETAKTVQRRRTSNTNSASSDPASSDPASTDPASTDAASTATFARRPVSPGIEEIPPF